MKERLKWFLQFYRNLSSLRIFYCSKKEEKYPPKFYLLELTYTDESSIDYLWACIIYVDIGGLAAVVLTTYPLFVLFCPQVLHPLFPAVIPRAILLVIQLVNILVTQVAITLAILPVITPATRLDIPVILLVIRLATIAGTLAHAIINQQLILDFLLILLTSSKMGPKARKPVFRGLRTTKAQTSLLIRAVWSAPLLFAYWK